MKRELCACYSSYNALRGGVVLCRNKQAAHDCVFFEANITILSPSFFFLQLFICSFLSASPYHFVLYYIRCGTRATSPSRCPPHKSTRWVLWAHLVASISLDESWAKLFSFSCDFFLNFLNFHSPRLFLLLFFKYLPHFLSFDSTPPPSLQAAGVLLPHYDSDANILYAAGKGDGNIRYWEYIDDKPHIFALSEYAFERERELR